MFIFRHRSSLKLILVLLCLLLAVTACTAFSVEEGEATATPLPTSVIKDSKVLPPQACLLAEQGMIRVEQPQGDLVAWSPVTDAVTYVASTQGSTWNVGDLYILYAPSFDNPIRLATQVAGDLSWSPGGINIAYVSLRRSDNLYTISLVSPDGRTSKDLFPDEAARTDGYSSQKTILEWVNEGRLRILTSCGLDCMQRYDFGILSGLSTPVGSPIQRTWDLWSVKTNLPAKMPPQYAALPGQLNWSPDETRIAYLDEKGNAWVINVEDGTLFPLDIGAYGKATETDWSFDNQYLALQVDQYLKIYAFNCP